MNKSKILELAFDGACYREDIYACKTEEYKKNNKKFTEILEKLCKDLPEEEKNKTLWDLTVAMGGIESAVEEMFFKEGFKLGLIIGAQNFLE
ncbi:MAG: hypothetical protein K2O89_07680 [Clostridia bacterium]|nr:hypothetical protein [Clostridia bacterium]